MIAYDNGRLVGKRVIFGWGELDNRMEVRLGQVC